MNKNIPITIAGQLFYIDEGAYHKLDTYLNSIKTSFAESSDSTEIVADIESRIAEHFSENKKPHERSLVTETDVDQLITNMGQPEDFADEAPASSGRNSKRLYRDTKLQLIGGVASGIAAYFGVSPLIIRLLFLLSLLVGGIGIIIYIILWILLPAATTLTEQMQMKGEPITLDSISEAVKEQTEAVRSNSGTFKKILVWPFVAIGAVIRFIGMKIAPIFVRIAGFIIAVAAASALFGVFLTTLIAAFNPNSAYVDPLVTQVLHGPQLYAALAIACVVAAIPLCFLLLLGSSMLRLHNIIHSGFGFTLLGIWFAALLAAGTMAPNVTAKYTAFIRSNPAYQQTTRSYDLNGFQKISVSDGAHVTVTQGPEFSVVAQGRSAALTDASIVVTNGMLEINEHHNFQFCLFCFSNNLSVTVTMPEVSSITASDSSSVTASGIHAADFALKLQDSSDATITDLQATNTVMTLSDSSSATITGSTQQESVILQDSSDLVADQFTADVVTIQASDSSSARVVANNSLTVKASDSSDVLYVGNPVVDEKSTDSSTVRRVE